MPAPELYWVRDGARLFPKKLTAAQIRALLETNSLSAAAEASPDKIVWRPATEVPVSASPAGGTPELFLPTEDAGQPDLLDAPSSPSVDLETASEPSSAGLGMLLMVAVIAVLGSAAAFVGVVWTLNPNPAVVERKPDDTVEPPPVEDKPTKRPTRVKKTPTTESKVEYKVTSTPVDAGKLDEKHRPAVVWLGLAGKTGVAAPIGTGFFVAKDSVATSADVAMVLFAQAEQKPLRIVAFHAGKFLDATAIRIHPGFDRQDPAGSVNLAVLSFKADAEHATLSGNLAAARTAKPGESWTVLTFLERKAEAKTDAAPVENSTAAAKLRAAVTGVDGVRGWQATANFDDPDFASGAPALDAAGRVLGVTIRSQRGPVLVAPDFGDSARWPIVWRSSE